MRGQAEEMLVGAVAAGTWNRRTDGTCVEVRRVALFCAVDT